MTRRTGLSLIELTITMLVIGILGALGSIKYADSLATHRRTLVVDVMTDSLKQYQHGASIRSSSVTVTFQKNKSLYTVTGIPNPTHPNKPYLVDLATIAPDLKFGDNYVLTFNAFGYPAAATTIEMRSNGVRKYVTVAASGAITHD